MSKLIVVVLSSLFAVGVAIAGTSVDTAKPAAPIAASASAASDCEAKAIGKNGKPLAGAAKASFLKKCENDAKGSAVAGSGCEAKAISKSGKPLAGAAKASFIKKCESDAKGNK